VRRESGAPTAVLVTVGDELLLGETVDSNAAWLGRRLARLGIDVARRYTVADDEDEIARAAREGLQTADVVLLTGGLGPTEDDRTRDAVAELLDRALAVDEDLLAALEARFRRRGYETLPERNVSQAQVPDGADVLPNPKGTAPGLALETGSGRVVVLLPGVPVEMEGIFDASVEPLLRERLGARLRPVHMRILHTTGISESELAGRVGEALEPYDGPVEVAWLPDARGVDLRLTVRGARDPDEAARELGRVESLVEPVIEPFRFEAAESGDLVEDLHRALEESGRTLAVAESCTGGLVAKRMTDRPGSSAVFVGGVVAYANAVKVDQLGVDPVLLEREGAVSEPVAVAMAEGVARTFRTACGLGVTGVAGPGGGTSDKPVGLVWYAASVDGRARVEHRHFPGDRASVRERSGQAALALLLEMLGGR